MLKKSCLNPESTGKTRAIQTKAGGMSLTKSGLGKALLKRLAAGYRFLPTSSLVFAGLCGTG